MANIWSWSTSSSACASQAIKEAADRKMSMSVASKDRLPKRPSALTSRPIMAKWQCQQTLQSLYQAIRATSRLFKPNLCSVRLSWGWVLQDSMVISIVLNLIDSVHVVQNVHDCAHLLLGLRHIHGVFLSAYNTRNTFKHSNEV